MNNSTGKTTDTKRIAINTGGGDAPGLNAVIRAVVLSALHRGWEAWGIRSGYDGLMGMEDGLIPMDGDRVRGITHRGGTILGTSNRGNPFKMVDADGPGGVEHDRSAAVVETFQEEGFDALVAIGGDGSLSIARDLHQRLPALLHQQSHKLHVPVLGGPAKAEARPTMLVFGKHQRGGLQS